MILRKTLDRTFQDNNLRLILAISSIIYIIFFTIIPIRIVNWGGMAVHEPLWSRELKNVKSWAMCFELNFPDIRIFATSPNSVGTSAGHIVKPAGESDYCTSISAIINRIALTRFDFDFALALITSVLFPLLIFMHKSFDRKILFAASALMPFIYDASTARVWFDHTYIFPGQHVYVAKTLVTEGIYGWTGTQIVGYGLPAEAAASWTPSGVAIPSGWTYPGYTLLLAAIYWPVLSTVSVSDASLATIAIVFNTALVCVSFWFLYRSGRLIGCTVQASLAPVYLVSLSGWAWSLCPFPASEPLQAAFIAAAIMIYLRCIVGVASPNIALLYLAVLAGVGQVTKPFVGLFPPLFLALALFWRFRRIIGWMPALASVLIAVAPTLLLGLRNFTLFGTWIFGSTVGGLFFAQSLDIAMTMPVYVGSSELEYGLAARTDIETRLNLLKFDGAYQLNLLTQRLALFFPSVIGLNFVTDLGRMGNDGYSGIALLLVGLTVSYFISIWRKLDALDIAILAMVAATFGALALTQPLGRYFAPLGFAYAFVAARMIASSSPTTLAGGAVAAFVLWIPIKIWDW